MLQLKTAGDVNNRYLERIGFVRMYGAWGRDCVMVLYDLK